MDMDSLQIGMSADNSKAIQSIDALCRKLGALNTQLTKGLNVSNYTQSINNLNSAINTFDGNKATQMANSVNGFVKAFSKFSNKKPMMAAQSITAISTGFKDLASSLSGVNFSGQIQNLIDLTSSVSKLGGKSTERAIVNMPLLTKEIRAFFDEMSKAPMVSDNTIRMTNALSNLAAQGGKVGSATSGLRRFFNYNSNNSINGFKGLFNTITSGSTKSSIGVKSLAYYFGKLYANYFLFIRMFGGLKESINYASELTEIQNVVDNVFGDATQKVEEFSKTAIEDFGMSILTTKKVASEYQAMANAMGITNEQVKESNKTWSLADQDINKTANAYNNAANSVADMSLNLTKLAADMGSFYNQEYDQVAERLASGIMTGQTRVLRQYGLDLTQATLKEWALTQGIEANFKTMTQAEKTMLRYQYVMSRTQNVQGDFLRTSMSWANVVRVLAQNFQNLGATIGGIGINAFRPLLIGINNAILKLNEFAIVVSNSLGKIFGWKYVGGGGSASTELEDMADSADGLAGGLGNAADNAKKLKSQLQGFDQLNVLSSDSNNGSGGSGSGGASGGSGSGGSSNNGGWERTESLFDSDLDTLGKLGSYISDKLASSLESIDWDSIYQGARNFGKGLADFLNGLITPRLFYDTGMTIASSLNTAIYASLSFSDNFDWKNFGESVANGINGFFETFDFKASAQALNSLVNGFETFFITAIEEIKWDKIFSAIGVFFGNLEGDTLLALIGIVTLKKFGKNFVAAISTSVSDYLGTYGLTLGSVVIGIALGAATFKLAGEATEESSILKMAESTMTAFFAGKILSGGSVKVGLKVAAVTFTFEAGFNLGKELGKWLFPEDRSYYDEFTWGKLADSFGYLCTDIMPQKAREMSKIIVTIFGTTLKASAELFQPLLNVIAMVGEASGLLSEDTANSMKNFSSTVETNVDAAITAFNNAQDNIGKTGDSVKNFKNDVNAFSREASTDIFYFGSNSSLMKKNITSDNNSLKGSYNVLADNVKNSFSSMKREGGGFRISSQNDFASINASLSNYEGTVKRARGTTSTETANMSGLYAGWYSNIAGVLNQSKASLSGYENSVKGAKNTTSTETTNISNLYSGLYRNISSNMSAGSTSVKNLGDENTKTKGKVDDLMKKSNQTFNIKTGSGFSSLSKLLSGITGGLSSIFGYSGKTLNLNLGKKAEGGAYYEGTWHAIPQYASGGSPSHGTMFIAGERGAEAVGHINGRTEVLNQSQMASVMYDAVLSGMSAAMARQGTNRVEVVLQGDAKGIFNIVRKEDRQYKNQNGHSAFGY